MSAELDPLLDVEPTPTDALGEPAPGALGAPTRSWAQLRGARLWPAVTLLLGLSLWAQLFGVGALAELQFDSPRQHALLAYLVPLLALGAGVRLRMAMLLLTFFPVLALPGLLMLPDAERLMLAEGLSMVRLSASLALYLAIASAGADVARLAEHAQPLEPSAEAVTLDYRRFVLARIGVLIVLFIVPLYAISQDAEIAAALLTHYRDKPEVAQTFLGLMHFFAWSVAAYMMVMMPALNLEYDQRRLERELAAWSARLARGLIMRRLALWIVLGALGLGLLGALAR